MDRFPITKVQSLCTNFKNDVCILINPHVIFKSMLWCYIRSKPFTAKAPLPNMHVCILCGSCCSEWTGKLDRCLGIFNLVTSNKRFGNLQVSGKNSENVADGLTSSYIYTGICKKQLNRTYGEMLEKNRCS